MGGAIVNHQYVELWTLVKNLLQEALDIERFVVGRNNDQTVTQASPYVIFCVLVSHKFPTPLGLNKKICFCESMLFAICRLKREKAQQNLRAGSSRDPP